MTLASFALIGGVLIFMFLGVPIAYSLGLSSILSILIDGKVSLLAFPQRLFVGIDSFPLLSIIFFMISGELMLQGGISKRLVNFATFFFSGIRGSLSYISLVACAFFGAISGSALATTATIGSVMYPQMLDDGTYDKDYALSIMAVGGTLGPMIPPSTPLIIYAILTGSSIGNVFLGVAIPGIIMCIIYCITAYLIMRKRNMGTNKHEMEKSLKNFWLTFKDGVWALLSPVLILGGIYSGICSPTEAAALACLYALIIGIFVYKELNIKKFYKSMFNATKSAASIMFLIANAMFFGWVMTVQGIPAMVTNVLLLLVDTPVAFLILINVIYLIAGMFMDCGCIILLVVPLMFPMARQLGINDVHFGAITCINLCLGAITPPFGACMFVASSIDKNVKLESIYKEVIPFCIFGTVGILIVTFMPILSTWML